jgi:hypothetical protein
MSQRRKFMGRGWRAAAEADGKAWLLGLLGYSLKESKEEEEEEDVLWFAIL